jgi:hypothetical protein
MLGSIGFFFILVFSVFILTASALFQVNWKRLLTVDSTWVT